MQIKLGKIYETAGGNIVKASIKEGRNFKFELLEKSKSDCRYHCVCRPDGENVYGLNIFSIVREVVEEKKYTTLYKSLIDNKVYNSIEELEKGDEKTKVVEALINAIDVTFKGDSEIYLINFLQYIGEHHLRNEIVEYIKEQTIVPF